MAFSSLGQGFWLFGRTMKGKTGEKTQDRVHQRWKGWPKGPLQHSTIMMYKNMSEVNSMCPKHDHEICNVLATFWVFMGFPDPFGMVYPSMSRETPPASPHGQIHLPHHKLRSWHCRQWPGTGYDLWWRKISPLEIHTLGVNLLCCMSWPELVGENELPAATKPAARAAWATNRMDWHLGSCIILSQPLLIQSLILGS